MVRCLLLSLICLLSGCATIWPNWTPPWAQQQQPRSGGVNHQPAPAAAPRATVSPTDEVELRRPAGAGQDASFERSSLLTETFYKSADSLLQQVERSGAMGVNRGWEAGARKGGEWYIEEQRFGDTVIGAGVNRNRIDLVEAGLRAFEWGFQQQAADGSFPCKDNYLSSAYFVAAVSHSIWLLETTGYAREFSARLATMRPRLISAARWLADPSHMANAKSQNDAASSRYFMIGYALGASARATGDGALAAAGEAHIRSGLALQAANGFFPERGGYDVSYQGEALVYLLRYHDHVASAEMRRLIEPAAVRALTWLKSRTQSNGVLLATGNTRTGNRQERDRTGQFRRVSAVAVSRAFGLARYVLGDTSYDALARSVATARQTS
jgi:hypothetical protein